MRPGHKFLLGASLIVASVALLMLQGVKEFGQYSLTPSELAAKTAADPTFYDLGLKMNAKVVPGTIRRDAASQTIDFQVTDGIKTFPVTFRSLAPTLSPISRTSKWSSKAGWAGTECSARPRCWPSVDRAMRRSTIRRGSACS